MLVAAVAGWATQGAAQTKWDMSIVWPAGNFHTRNAMAYAEAVKQRTGGRVDITVHAGGALGLKGPETLKAVQNGIVPLGEMTAFQQVGEEPILGIESVPFLVGSYDDLAALHEFAIPEWRKALQRHNQELLYAVPFPAQNVFVKTRAQSLADLKGVKIRTYDKNSSDLMTRLGMVPVQLPWADVVPSLSSGVITAVMTSSTSAVDGKFWETLKFAYRTNHIWGSNILTVNRDALKKLSPADQEVVLKAAAEMQPAFWNVSREDDDKSQATLRSNGLVIEAPPGTMQADMRSAAAPMWDEFAVRVPAAAPIIKAYRTKTGR
jgi:TRAP-type C4-dicarboxylate transport system substrate-binding protein